MLNKDHIVIVILAGGFGTRVQHLLKDVPKPLAVINNYPFLYWLITFYIKYGYKKFILACHYKRKNFDTFVKKYFPKFDISIIEEPEPMGTFGSFVNVYKNLTINNITYDKFLLINGDSLSFYDPNLFIDTSKNYNISIVSYKVKNAARYGSLIINDKNELLSFDEKCSGSGLINAGIYLFDNDYLKNLHLKISRSSIEYDFIPNQLCTNTKIKIFTQVDAFIDIGTERSLKIAKEFIKKNF